MINYDLTLIKAVMLDVDGVLSCETINMGIDGVPQRTANIKDGYIIQLAVKLGLSIAIITGGKCPSIYHRYHSLGVEEIHLGCSVKKTVFQDLLRKYGLQPEEVLYMGDDIPDYEVMQLCGCPCCPSDAAPEIKQISRYVSSRPGGHGCVRDVIEQVLRARGLWKLDHTAFGW